jgi:hypothetical protein
MQTCELPLNFLSFEAFEGQKVHGCSLLHLALVFHARLPTMKRDMMSRRTN